jgi:hypothetical protein
MIGDAAIRLSPVFRLAETIGGYANVRGKHPLSRLGECATSIRPVLGSTVLIGETISRLTEPVRRLTEAADRVAKAVPAFKLGPPVTPIEQRGPRGMPAYERDGVRREIGFLSPDI